MKQIGRYQLISKLGQGGMGVVYAAHDPILNRQVAIKLLPSHLLGNPGIRRRFVEEARTVAQLQHPNIVKILDYGEYSADQLSFQPYFVMELLEGGSLEDRLRNGQSLPLAEIKRILAHLAPAFDAAHSMNLVHRDVKPGNILFDRHNIPYLSDFGIARLAASADSITLTGTPSYMAPEQYTGQSGIDERTDVYQLGVTIYQMVTGFLPFQTGTPQQAMYQHLNVEPLRLQQLDPQLPAPWSDVVAKSLAKDPEDRYPSVNALVTALDEAGHSLSFDTLVTKLERANHLPIEPLVTLILITLTLGLLLVLVSFFWNREAEPILTPTNTIEFVEIAEATATHTLNTSAPTNVPTPTSLLTSTLVPTDTLTSEDIIRTTLTPKPTSVDLPALSREPTTNILAILFILLGIGVSIHSLYPVDNEAVADNEGDRRRHEEMDGSRNNVEDSPTLSTPNEIEAPSSNETILAAPRVTKLLVHEGHPQGILDELVSHNELKQLQDFFKAPQGGRYILTGYGRFGGTSLMNAALRRSQQEFGENADAISDISPSLLLAVQFDVDEELVDGKQKFNISANNFILGTLEIESEAINFELSAPENQSLFNFFQSRTQGGQLRQVRFEQFTSALKAFLDGRREEHNNAQTLIQQIISNDRQPEKVLIVLDQIKNFRTLEKLMRTNLFDDPRVQVIIIARKENFDHWDTKHLDQLQKSGFRDWYVPCT